MDHMKVLKRAWRILWSYKALWIFGIILALTTSSGNSSGNSGAQFSRQFNGGGQGQNAPFTLPQNVQSEIEALIRAAGQFFRSTGVARIAQWAVAAAVAFLCVIFILVIIGVVARLVSKTALIRMVDTLEETGERVTVGRGFGLGWSRSAWRIFLIDLLIGLPLAIAFILLFVLAAAPLLLWITRNTVVGVFGTVTAIGLFFLAILAVIVVGIAARLLMRFAWRACAIEGLGVTESIGRGYDVIRGHLKDVGLMWLIMLGINLAYVVLLIPVFLVVLIAGGLTGGAVLLLVHGIARLFAGTVVSWIIGVVVAAPVFLVVMTVPMAFVGGLREVYQSTTWTLTYREVTALDALGTAAVPDPADKEAETPESDHAEDVDDEGQA